MNKIQSASAKMRKPKSKKVGVTLFESDLMALKLYCQKEEVTPAVAIRHILRDGLKDYSQDLSRQETKNQLDIFDSMQIDLFNNTSKTE